MNIKKEEYCNMLMERYAEELTPDMLVDEAIAALEDYFRLMDEQEFLHHNRVMAISYLALKHIESQDH